MSKVVLNASGSEICCKTSAGAAFVKKITHPPTTMPSDYRGTPDSSAPNVVLMELKAEANIQCNINIPTSATASSNVQTPSLMFLKLPGARAACYIFHLVNGKWVQPFGQTVTATTPLINAVNPASINNGGYNFANFSSDCQMYRNVYSSLTFYLNATAFSDQGIVTTAKFKPATFVQLNAVGFYLETLRTDEKHAAAFLKCLPADIARACLKRAAKEIKASEGYEVIDKNVGDDITSNYNVQVFDVVGTATQLTNAASTVYAIDSIDLPSSTTGLLNASPKASTRPAKEGAFVVHQKVGEIFEWAKVYNQATLATAPNNLIQTCLRVTNGSTVVYVPLVSSFNTNGFVPAAETPWNNLDASITLFEGLSVSSANPTQVNPPYITVKSFHGMEIQTANGSSLLSFARTLPLPDQDAIIMSTGIFEARPDSLPASANDLASIGAAIAGFVPTAISWLKDLFGSKKEKEAEKPPEWQKYQANKNFARAISRPGKPSYPNVQVPKGWKLVANGSNQPKAKNNGKRRNNNKVVKEVKKVENEVKKLQLDGRSPLPTMVFHNRSIKQQ